MKQFKYYIFALVAALSSLSVKAQTVNVTLPYTMSFEDDESAELVNWHINPGAQASQCKDYWYRGAALHSDGRRGMYIVSEDSVFMPMFGDQMNVQFIYRDFVLPIGDYNISFDYIVQGGQDAALYAGYCMFGATPTVVANKVEAIASSGLMPAQLTGASTFGPLYNQSTWSTLTFNMISITSPRTVRLYFGWANNSQGAAGRMSAAVDNIQITDARCTAPQSVTAETISCDSVRVTWDATSDGYELNYRLQGASSWSRSYSEWNNPGEIILENMQEGSYNVRLRNICHNVDGVAMYSAWTNAEDLIVFCPELHCVNYVDLTSPSVSCMIGEYNMDTYTHSGAPTYGLVDYGAESPLSRHTVIWDRTATDPRTGGALKMVPNGAMASVRLHTWNPTGRYYSAVEYETTVDSVNSILLVKYALVQEYASYHSPTAQEQARFYLEIQDQNGRVIDASCGAKTLRAGYDSDNWEWVGKSTGRPLTSEDVVWRDWTTMGLDLAPYVGQTIRIHVESSGCAESAHYGYAYFALDCKAAQIVSTSCGAEEGTTMDVEAPEGFSYQWINAAGQVVSTNRTYQIPATDTETYICRMTDLENSGCYFDLTTASYPRYPRPDFRVMFDPVDCQNRYRFTNRTRIMAYWDGVEREIDDFCNYEWDFGDGQTDGQKNSVHTFPQEGGTYLVTLSAWLNGGAPGNACYKDTVIEVHVPKLGDVVVPIDTAICDGSYLTIGGKPYYRDTVVSVLEKSRAGCDSTLQWTLRINPTYQINLEDSIWVGETICIGEDCRSWKEEDTYNFVGYLSTTSGCDSVVARTVVVSKRPCMDVIDQRWNDVLFLKAELREEVENRFGTGYLEQCKYMWYYINELGERVSMPEQDKAYYYEEPMLLRATTYGCYLITPAMELAGKNKPEILDSLNLDTQDDMVLICEFDVELNVPTAVDTRKFMNGEQLYIQHADHVYNSFGARVY